MEIAHGNWVLAYFSMYGTVGVLPFPYALENNKSDL
jgi:hypothetical protein